MSDVNVLLYVLVRTWICENSSKWCVNISFSCEPGGTLGIGSLVEEDHVAGRADEFPFPYSLIWVDKLI